MGLGELETSQTHQLIVKKEEKKTMDSRVKRFTHNGPQSRLHTCKIFVWRLIWGRVFSMKFKVSHHTTFNVS